MWPFSRPLSARPIAGASTEAFERRLAERAAVALDHPAAELVHHHLLAIADAQDRDPATPYRGVRLGSLIVVHGHRAAGQDDGARAAAFKLFVGRVVREELAVDVQFSHPTRDELRELAAEVKDDDRTGGRGGRGLGGGSSLGGRVERRLQVCLHLRVVGGEDPVAGVRGLTVDEARPEAQAMAIRGDRIAALGTNEAIQAYNTARRQFPANITAGIFGFKDDYKLFEAPPEAKVAPKVQFTKPQ